MLRGGERVRHGRERRRPRPEPEHALRQCATAPPEAPHLSSSPEAPHLRLLDGLGGLGSAPGVSRRAASSQGGQLGYRSAAGTADRRHSEYMCSACVCSACVAGHVWQAAVPLVKV